MHALHACLLSRAGHVRIRLAVCTSVVLPLTCIQDSWSYVWPPHMYSLYTRDSLIRTRSWTDDVTSSPKPCCSTHCRREW